MAKNAAGRIFLDDRSFIESSREFIPFAGRPDPTEAERAAKREADRIPVSTLLREFGWSVDHLDHAIAAHGFPRPIVRSYTLFGRGEPVYSRSQIETWRQKLLAFAATVR